MELMWVIYQTSGVRLTCQPRLYVIIVSTIIDTELTNYTGIISIHLPELRQAAYNILTAIRWCKNDNWAGRYGDMKDGTFLNRSGIIH
jgi:hypothetical protein